MAKETEWVTVKVPKKTHAIAKRLLAKASAGGWQALGADRKDALSLGALYDEAIRRLTQGD